MPRLGVQFRAAFSDTQLRGDGVMLDLSSGGCRIESPNLVEPGMSLELHIYAGDLGWPIMVEAATVQWVGSQTFGLAFFRITEAERRRLGKMVRTLMGGVTVGRGASLRSHPLTTCTQGLEPRM